MKKLLTVTASALVLMAASGAQAHDHRYHDDRDHHTRYNAGGNAAIQKGQSASVKSYGYNKQGDHYNTDNVRNSSWDARYPGNRNAFGTKAGVTIKKGGSGITDTMVNESASTRAYGNYWN